MNNTLKPVCETLQLEKELDKKGSVIWKCNGISMLPFIKPEKDLVILESTKSEPKPYDVVMYIRQQNSTKEYVLHRLMNKEDDTYVILGDNCTTLEYVEKDKVIALMTDIIRDGKKIEIDTLWYKLYMQLWIKPWKFRIITIKTKHKIKSVLKKIKKKL